VAVLQALADGLLIGGVYAVLSLGLTLVFGVMGIVNFAHAQFVMVGMYAAWFAWRYLGLDPLLASPLAFAAAFLLAAAIERFLIRRVLAAPAVAQVFLTVGLLIALENVALIAFGSDYRSVRTPYQTSSVRLGPIYLSVPYLAAFALSAATAGALWLFLRHTWAGRAMRATAQDRMAASLIGIDPARMTQLAFALGAGLTAFGGAVILPYITVSPGIGGQFVVLMFTVVVLGGLGDVGGALLGGLVAGVIQSVSVLVFPIQLQNLVLFVVFIAVLAFRPQGLLRGLA
jgi:branched-chain amino acid transport system permease protein